MFYASHLAPISKKYWIYMSIDEYKKHFDSTANPAKDAYAKKKEFYIAERVTVTPTYANDIIDNASDAIGQDTIYVFSGDSNTRSEKSNTSANLYERPSQAYESAAPQKQTALPRMTPQNKPETTKSVKKQDENQRQSSQTAEDTVKNKESDSNLPEGIEKAYALGTRGQAIRTIKKRMQELGYFSATAKLSDQYNELMADRVKQFQKNNGLPATGNLDEQTMEALFSDTAISK